MTILSESQLRGTIETEIRKLVDTVNDENATQFDKDRALHELHQKGSLPGQVQRTAGVEYR